MHKSSAVVGMPSIRHPEDLEEFFSLATRQRVVPLLIDRSHDALQQLDGLGMPHLTFLPGRTENLFCITGFQGRSAGKNGCQGGQMEHPYLQWTYASFRIACQPISTAPLKVGHCCT